VELPNCAEQVTETEIWLNGGSLRTTMTPQVASTRGMRRPFGRTFAAVAPRHVAPGHSQYALELNDIEVVWHDLKGPFSIGRVSPICFLLLRQLGKETMQPGGVAVVHDESTTLRACFEVRQARPRPRSRPPLPTTAVTGAADSLGGLGADRALKEIAA
jgi:hypothetical protein